MERKIGEIFPCNGKWYQCLEGTGCHKCDFNIDENTCGIENPYCTGRSDKKDVIFKKLEKVGEPYIAKNSIIGERLFQKYKLYKKDFFINEKNLLFTNFENTVGIEIKQNKEDMEEKKVIIGELAYKYINGKITYESFEKGIKELCDNKEESKPTLKEFDLEAARSGNPVCTRGGRKARIICFDYAGETGDYPIVALVSYDKGNNCYERVLKYTSDGLFNKYGDYKHDDDLMMLPEKKEGWVNVYNSLGVVTFSHNPYDTKEEALEELKSASGRAYCVDTIKVNWSE